ncbi:MAG TPA: nucleoside deaminase [Agriterribacter sp.]|nr:nucleoside deaminase [Agriterribacter sp.]HRQ51183.1 nucleoside deaminase [Agriterribacter sp.]
MKSDTDWIQRCGALARAAAAKGESPVGALIVKNRVLISEAMESVKSNNDITCHAEIEAIRLAIARLSTNDLSDCILYTTHEPCLMCSYAIRFHKIKKLVYQHAVKYLGGVSSSMPLLTTDDVPPHWGPAPVIIHPANRKEQPAS